VSTNALHDVTLDMTNRRRETNRRHRVDSRAESEGLDMTRTDDGEVMAVDGRDLLDA
jgi:hypothetical protein